MSGILTVVGTPLGNLGDMSPRAVEALRQADFIAAEDTRVTLKLLNHFEIKKRGITVSVVPGPSALIAALAVSGLPTGRFTFEGFLSTNKKSRRDHLEQVKNETRTMIFYEAPHKLHACLRDMYAAWGDRRIAVVHELTKIHEEVIRTTLKAAAARYSEGNIKGEFVLVIEGAKPEELQKGYTLEQAVEIAAGLMREQGMSASEAAKTASQQTGLKKGDIYKGALALK